MYATCTSVHVCGKYLVHIHCSSEVADLCIDSGTLHTSVVYFHFYPFNAGNLMYVHEWLEPTDFSKKIN